MHIGYNFIILCFIFLLVACNKDDDAITQPINPSINDDEAKDCSNAQRYDEVLKKCVNICTENEFFDITTEGCRKTMPNSIEEKICQGDLALDKVTSKCACFGRSKEDPINKNCVCEAGAHYSKIDADCVCYNQNKFYNPLYSRCTLFCKEGEELFMLSNGEFQLCVPKCKNGYFYNLSESMCVQKCEGNSYRKSGEAACSPGKQLTLTEGFSSILPSLKIEKDLVICLVVDPELKDNAKKIAIERSKEITRESINKWLEPLRSFGNQIFKKEFTFIESNGYGCDPSPNMVTIFFPWPQEQMNDACGAKGAPGCANCGSKTIHLSANLNGTEREVPVFMHELGHLFGFDDQYIQGIHKEPCRDGYGLYTTVMCYEGIHLKPADVEGIQNLYCRFFQNEDPVACAALQQRFSFAAISSS
ncbi:MAG: hypothetical protein HQK53_12790 [Oligoflexia bacterium]|nr:hypothetical protein [Oligoflexia bacterium]